MKIGKESRISLSICHNRKRDKRESMNENKYRKFDLILKATIAFLLMCIAIGTFAMYIQMSSGVYTVVKGQTDVRVENGNRDFKVFTFRY